MGSGINTSRKDGKMVPAPSRHQDRTKRKQQTPSKQTTAVPVNPVLFISVFLAQKQLMRKDLKPKNPIPSNDMGTVFIRMF